MQRSVPRSHIGALFSLFLLALGVALPVSEAGGDTLFGVDVDTNQLLTIDSATGVATAVGPLGDVSVVGMTYDPTSGTLYGAGGRLSSIDRQTGMATEIGGPLGFSVVGLAAHPITGQLYGVDSIADVLVTIDANTGIATEVGPLGGGTAFANVTGLAFDPAGQTLYGVENGNDQLVTIDPTTGTATGVGSPFTVGGLVVTALAFDPDTGDLFGGDAAGMSVSQLVSIDPMTGVGNAIGPTGFNLLEALAFAPAIPEPSGLLLGLIAMGATSLRRRKVVG